MIELPIEMQTFNNILSKSGELIPIFEGFSIKRGKQSQVDDLLVLVVGLSGEFNTFFKEAYVGKEICHELWILGYFFVDHDEVDGAFNIVGDIC